MQSSIGPEQVCFGRFRFDLRRCRLLHDDEPIELGGRALEVLRLLALANGAVVSKDELMTRLWRGRTVEENNLHVHISALRKALSQHGEGESYVITVPGRGYRLAHPNGSQPARASGSSPTQHPSLPDKPSIAVLPFANLSADPEQQYFVDGMVEEIITALSRIQWLFVIARNSSFIYKGQNINVTRIGSELGVHYVLEGSIRRAGDRVRITAQLIDAGSDAHLWADRFDGSLEDVFEIQDRVAARVAGAIEPALQAREIRRSGGRPTDDLSAYDLFLRARELYDSHERTEVVRALELLNRAIACDERYGDALSLAAQCHATLDVGGWADDADTNRRQGIGLAHRALRVSGDNPIVTARAAYVLGNLGEDINAAIALIDRCLAMNSNLALGWHHSGWLRLWAGQADKAIEHLLTAERLNPHARRLELAIGVGYFFARRFEEARAMLLRSLQRFPGWVANYRFLAACCAHMGRADEAREMVQQLRSLTPLIVPTAEHWRDPQQRELYLSGLRLAVGTGETSP